MYRLINASLRWLVFGVSAVILVSLAGGSAFAGPTPEEYIEHVGEGARIVPAGKLKLGRFSGVYCGRRPTVIDNSLDDYGAAYPGFLILNMKLLKRLPSAVQLWIYSHECSHQFRGPDEEVADCFAIQRLRTRYRLTPKGLEEICRFIGPASASLMHSSGKVRCQKMRGWYKAKTKC